MPAMKKAPFQNDIPTTVLHRVDPSCNMARFYVMSISPSLFGDVALVRSWGRLTKKGRVKIQLFGSSGEAEVARARLISKKLARGYRTGIYPHEPRASDTGQLDLFG